MEVFLSFFCVEFFAAGDVLVLGVVEDQVLYAKLFCQFAGIFGCGVMFLVWVESVCLVEETECFVEKPFAVFGVFFLAFVVWFVTTAGEFLAIAYIHAEAKLFRFGGLDVEESRLISHDGSFFSFFYDYQM